MDNNCNNLNVTIHYQNSMKINCELLANFIRCRLHNGIPSKSDIIERINKTATKSVFPANWIYR
jgi:hypothetical protein